jgi:hypothetical protein
VTPSTRYRPGRRAWFAALASVTLLHTGCATADDPVDDTEEQESTVAEDVERVGVVQGTISSHGGLRIGLTSTTDGAASADIKTGPENYYENHMPVGRRVVVGIWEIEVLEVDDGYAAFAIRDHDRDPTEPVALRVPSAQRSYPPGVSVKLLDFSDGGAELEVAVRTAPDAAAKHDQWQQELVTLDEGGTVEVHGYGIAWHERRDDELLVTITRPDGSELVPPADVTGDDDR